MRSMDELLPRRAIAADVVAMRAFVEGGACW